MSGLTASHRETMLFPKSHGQCVEVSVPRGCPGGSPGTVLPSCLHPTAAPVPDTPGWIRKGSKRCLPQQGAQHPSCPPSPQSQRHPCSFSITQANRGGTVSCSQSLHDINYLAQKKLLEMIASCTVKRNGIVFVLQQFCLTSKGGHQ